MLSYIWFKKKETIDLLLITIVLSFLFSITIQRFETQTSIFTLLLQFFIFLAVLLFSRLLFMKAFAYRHGFQLFLHQTHFSKYGPRAYDSLSAFARDFLNVKFRGVPSTILAIIIFIVTLGTIIVPSLWRYSVKKIPHKFVGTREKFEYGMPQLRRNVTEYRIMKVLFLGYIYYLLFAFLLKIILPEEMFYSWFVFALFWIAFFTLLPIPGTEGWDFFVKSRLAYVTTLVILTLGMMCVLIFKSLTTILPIIAIIGGLILFIIFYKYFLFE